MLKMLKKRQKPKVENMPNQVMADSGYAESFRTLQANLQFSVLDKNLKSICVTSATEMEGKTNTVANLGHTMAQSGQRVLMLDCDLRKPGLTKKFGLSNATGLTELMSQDFGAVHNQGSLNDICLKDLVKLKKFQKKTGVLSVSDDYNQVDLSFLSGNLTNIFWKNRPAKKKLASALIRKKRLKKQQAQVALRQHQKSGQKLGTTLILMGLISKEELKQFLSVHLFDAFKTVVSMCNGKFAFAELPVSQIDTTIEQGVNFDKLFTDFMEDDSQSVFLTKTINSVVARTGTKNLFLLPSGNIPIDPSQILSSNKMTFLLDYLTRIFDIVIIDTPPVMPVSDVIMIAPKTDGILVVLKAKKVNKKHIKSVIRKLENSSVKILGLILNRVNVKKERYYKYYKKYHLPYYGKTG